MACTTAVAACENTVRRLCRHTRRCGTDCPDRARSASVPRGHPPGCRRAHGGAGFVNAHIHPAQTFVGGPWVDYDYADTVPGRAKAEAEYLANHGRMNSLRNCYVQFREAIRRGTTHVRGHIDVGVFGLAELEDAARAREAFRDVLDIEYVAMPSNGILNMKTDPEQTIAAPCAREPPVSAGPTPRPGPRSRALPWS